MIQGAAPCTPLMFHHAFDSQPMPIPLQMPCESIKHEIYVCLDMVWCTVRLARWLYWSRQDLDLAYCFDKMRQVSLSGCRGHVPYILNHRLQLNIIPLLILAFGFGNHAQKQIASVKADLHAFAHCQVYWRHPRSIASSSASSV